MTAMTLEARATSIISNGNYTIRQKSNGRFLDAHENAANDFRLVTRTAQNNDSQVWELVGPNVGIVWTLRQKSSGRYLDAHEDAANDYRLVTRPAQNNNSQRWVSLPAGGGDHTLQQLSNLRFVDAHEDAAHDFRLVTRPAQNNDTQVWMVNLIRRAGPVPDPAEEFLPLHRRARERRERLLGGHAFGAEQRHPGLGQDDRGSQSARSAEEQRPLPRRARERRERFRGGHPHRTEQQFPGSWVVVQQGDGSYTLQQLNNGRYIDAHEFGGE